MCWQALHRVQTTAWKTRRLALAIQRSAATRQKPSTPEAPETAPPAAPEAAAASGNPSQSQEPPDHFKRRGSVFTQSTVTSTFLRLQQSLAGDGPKKPAGAPDAAHQEGHTPPQDAKKAGSLPQAVMDVAKEKLVFHVSNLVLLNNQGCVHPFP